MEKNNPTINQLATRYQIALDLLVSMIIAMDEPEADSGSIREAIGQEGGEGNQQERVAKLCEGSQG